MKANKIVVCGIAISISAAAFANEKFKSESDKILEAKNPGVVVGASLEDVIRNDSGSASRKIGESIGGAIGAFGAGLANALGAGNNTSKRVDEKQLLKDEILSVSKQNYDWLYSVRVPKLAGINMTTFNVYTNKTMEEAGLKVDEQNVFTMKSDYGGENIIAGVLPFSGKVCYVWINRLSLEGKCDLVYTDSDGVEYYSNMRGIKAFFKEAVGKEVFLWNGTLYAENGNQQIVFGTKRVPYHSKAIYYRSEVALIDKQLCKTAKEELKQRLTHDIQILQKRKQAEDDYIASKPAIDSFLGVEFGVVLNGGELSSDGKSVVANIELPKPFRGVQTATVYASVSSRKVFKIELFANDSQTELVKVCQNRYKFDERYEDLRGSNIRIELKNALLEIKSGEYGQGVLSATHNGYLKVSEEEYKKESGGDGSSVL